MQSAMLGENISEVEITHVSKHGFWLLLDDKELFLPFVEFPWFKRAPLEAIFNIERLQLHHLYWPDLDIDLTVESIEHPEWFPLIAVEPPALCGTSKDRITPALTRHPSLSKEGKFLILTLDDYDS